MEAAVILDRNLGPNKTQVYVIAMGAGGQLDFGIKALPLTQWSRKGAGFGPGLSH